MSGIKAEKVSVEITIGANDVRLLAAVGGDFIRRQRIGDMHLTGPEGRLRLGDKDAEVPQLGGSRLPLEDRVTDPLQPLLRQQVMADTGRL